MKGQRTPATRADAATTAALATMFGASLICIATAAVCAAYTIGPEALVRAAEWLLRDPPRQSW